MESSSSRQEAEERRQTEIRRQIARLQAELVDPSAASHSSSSYGVGGSNDVNGLPKRKQLDGNLLVPRSPSPSTSSGHLAPISLLTRCRITSSERRKVDDQGAKTQDRAMRKPSAPRTESRATSQIQPPIRNNVCSSRTPSNPIAPPPKPAPSNLLNKLSQLSGQSQKVNPTEVLERSTAFNARPAYAFCYMFCLSLRNSTFI